MDSRGVDSSGGEIRKNDPRGKLIVALDVSTAAAAQKIVAAVGDSALTYKVGMQLYTAELARNWYGISSPRAAASFST